METTLMTEETGVGLTWLGDGHELERQQPVPDCEKVARMSLAEALYWVLTAGRGGETLAQG